MSTVRMSSAVYAEVRTHLFPAGSRVEQGGFMFCQFEETEAGRCFRAVEWMPLQCNDFEHQGTDYLELTDTARAHVIKHAHDLSASLVEIHSHPGPYPAAFSPYDLTGLREFVPHVRWRLKGCPYGALVFARNDVDGLAWIGNSHAPVQVMGIQLDSELVATTGLTLKFHFGGIYGSV